MFAPREACRPPDIGLTFGARHVTHPLAGRQPPYPTLIPARRGAREPPGLKFSLVLPLRRRGRSCNLRHARASPPENGSARRRVRLELPIDTRRTTLAWCLALAGACSLLHPVPAAAQSTTATIVGTVTDETGGMLPGVSVVVTNTGTSLTRTLVTDASGRYAAPNLPPGAYEIKASLEGFGTVLGRGVTLTVGREAVVDLTLKLGQMSSEMTVVGEAPTVDLKN